ncbi:hypothetical protein MSG28_014099 [Choristoneura fumiferana]|uniref:Uncharacterized protein n=1 Tax=Choristoneura fumiferana TaxID=7141 RepID=A0ACC0JFU4_CHOFU|nr:hypothetical protein MSG28_014099 [Choristoneura fumiferana]
MPEFSDEERAFVKGATDFFGVNHYTSYLISATDYKRENLVPGLLDDVDAGLFVPEDWPQSASAWLTQAPNSTYNALTHLKAKYNDPVIYITENGWSTHRGLVDDDRIQYYRAALESALDALDAGVNLKGYMAWSLVDNFEWMEGYTELFGLYEVDFSDSARTRTPRKSAFVYKHIIKNRVIDHDYQPDSSTMTIDE